MSEVYTYEYPRPAVTVDAVLFWPGDEALSVLLIERKHDPYGEQWALPGGFLEIDEELDDGVRRELLEETSVGGVQLAQIGTFGTLGRDPRTRTISVAYLGVVDGAALAIKAADDAANVAWFDVTDLPPLAFDHSAIIAHGRRFLSESLRYLGVGAHVLPETFDMTTLQRLYETLAGQQFDATSFARELLNLGVLDVAPGENRRYRFNPARVAPF